MNQAEKRQKAILIGLDGQPNVGNWPGKTVERRENRLHSHPPRLWLLTSKGARLLRPGS